MRITGTVTHRIGLRPSPWLIDNSGLLQRPTRGSSVVRAIDVASGSGRHALWLAAAGFETEAVSIEMLRQFRGFGQRHTDSR